MQKYLILSAIIVIAILILLLNRSCRKNERLDDMQDMYSAINDTLIKTRNDLGQEVTTRTVLYSDIATLKRMVGIRDSTVLALQKIINKNTNTATILVTTTAATAIGETDTIILRDTIRINDSIALIYPEYKKTFKDKWYWANVSSNKDSTILKFQVFNEFDIIHEWKRSSIFKQKSLLIQVTNKNPYTETNNIQSFVVKQKKSNKLLIFAGGITIGIGLSVYVYQKLKK